MADLQPEASGCVVGVGSLALQCSACCVCVPCNVLGLCAATAVMFGKESFLMLALSSTPTTGPKMVHPATMGLQVRSNVSSTSKTIVSNKLLCVVPKHRPSIRRTV